jgi:hypothetical protein
MRADPLVDFPVLPLRITVRACDLVRLPPHAASTLRGALGGELRRLV